MIEELSFLALLAPTLIYGFILALHAFLPARRVTGYVVDPKTRQPQVYRLNGLLVLIIVLGCFLLAVTAGWTDPAWFYDERWSLLMGACVLGVVYTLILVVPAPPTGKGLLKDLFLGRVENREVFDCVENRQVFNGIDTKMYLYLAGAVMLVLNAVSFAAAHHQIFGAQANPGVYVHAGLLVLFVTDYLWFEEVHLYTYDLFAERLGFKLAWGCLVFYPFFIQSVCGGPRIYRPRQPSRVLAASGWSCRSACFCWAG